MALDNRVDSLTHGTSMGALLDSQNPNQTETGGIVQSKPRSVTPVWLIAIFLFFFFPAALYIIWHEKRHAGWLLALLLTYSMLLPLTVITAILHKSITLYTGPFILTSTELALFTTIRLRLIRLGSSTTIVLLILIVSINSISYILFALHIEITLILHVLGILSLFPASLQPISLT